MLDFNWWRSLHNACKSLAKATGRRARSHRRASPRVKYFRPHLEWLEDRRLLAYTLGGPASTLTPLSSNWSWQGGANIDSATSYRGAIQDPGYFGVGGIVGTSITTTNLSTIDATTLAPLDGFISTWWADTNTPAAAVTAIQTFFLGGGDLILLNDDSSHDKIAETLGIPTSVSTGTVSNDGSPLFVGPFGTATNVTQNGAVGQLTAADISAHGGHVGATNASGQITAAYWNEGDYAPGAGRMLIVADIDMWANYYPASATYYPLNSNGIFALNGTAFIVGGPPPSVAANSASVSASEGTPVTNTGTFSDPDGNATVTLTASVGTITQNNALGIWSWSLSTSEGPAGPNPVSITATDTSGNTATAVFN